MRIWVNAGLLLVLAALMTYVLIYFFYRNSLLGVPLRGKLSYLISRVPDEDSPAWPHVLGGVLMCLGFCLLVGSYVALMPFVSADFNRHSTALTAGGLMFAVLISAVSFWTLWQTKKIEQIQGSNVGSFRELIEMMVRDMESLSDDFRANNNRVREHHRVFLVTTNPYFGKLSFPFDKVTQKFEDAMSHNAKHVKSSSSPDRTEGFQMEVLCGDLSAIVKFHQIFYRGKGEVVAATDDNQVVKASQDTEAFIRRLNEDAGCEIVHRAQRVPKTQFAIIGNVVYEFILEAPGFQSEIHRARRIGDKVACDRFLETFRLLKDLSVKGDTPDERRKLLSFELGGSQ
jgi:hypothetical protein